MDELPADAEMTVHHTRSPSGDAMPYRADPTEFLDIEMDQFARLLALITTDRFGRLQGAELVEPAPFENAADSRRRNADFSRDLSARVALAAQDLDGIACGLR